MGSFHAMHMASRLSLTSATPAQRLLYIGGGEVQEMVGEVRQFSVALTRLCAETLRSINPDVVIFPLIRSDQDAVCVLETLRALGYRGACLVLSPPLPKPQPVEAELRAVGRGMQVKLEMCA
jgi:hypothetical protein